MLPNLVGLELGQCLLPQVSPRANLANASHSGTSLLLLPNYFHFAGFRFQHFPRLLIFPYFGFQNYTHCSECGVMTGPLRIDLRLAGLHCYCLHLAMLHPRAEAVQALGWDSNRQDHSQPA